MARGELSREDEEKVIAAIRATLEAQPPTIGIIGTSGTGKSSTINAMFKTRLPVSHVVACTKEFRTIDLRVPTTGGPAAGSDALLRVIDAPGLGEDVSRDPTYLELYHQNLAACDVILWVLAARNRAVALDQQYLSQFAGYQDRMLFGVNQVDLVDPMDWNERINLPSSAQEANIARIVTDRSQRLASILGRPVDAIAYSATTGFRLQELFTRLIETCPPDRAWIFSAIKNFGPFDFIPEELRDQILDELDEDDE